MLKISKLADYAVILMCFLAEKENTTYSAQQIADLTRISLPTVRKLLNLLSAATLLHATRGQNGGYSLKQSAHDIHLLNVIEAIEGKIALTGCCDAEQNCERTDTCKAKENWQHINQCILQLLMSVDLKQMNGSITPRSFWTAAVEVATK